MSQFKNLLILILGVLAFAYAKESQNRKHELARAEQNLQTANTAFEINKGQLAHFENENAELKELIKEYKDAESITKVVTNTSIDTVYVQYDSIIRVSDDGSFFGRVDIDSTYYSLSCRFTEKAFTLENLSIPNESNIIVGERKIRGIFGIPKGKEYAVDIINSNPHVQTVNIQTFKIVEEPAWYETRGFAIGAGVVAGFILAK